MGCTDREQQPSALVVVRQHCRTVNCALQQRGIHTSFRELLPNGLKAFALTECGHKLLNSRFKHWVSHCMVNYTLNSENLHYLAMRLTESAAIALIFPPMIINLPPSFIPPLGGAVAIIETAPSIWRNQKSASTERKNFVDAKTKDANEKSVTPMLMPRDIRVVPSPVIIDQSAIMLYAPHRATGKEMSITSPFQCHR